MPETFVVEQKLMDTTIIQLDTILSEAESDTLGVFENERIETVTWLPVEEKGLYGYYDPEKDEFIIKGQYEEAGLFSDGWAAVKKNDQWMFIDSNNQVMLKTDYEIRIEHHELSGEVLPCGFSFGLCPVWNNDKAGFIDKQGNVVVPLKYRYVGMFYEGLAVFSIPDANADEPEWESLSGILDSKGREIVKPIYDHISDYENGFARVFNGNDLGFLNRRGKLAFPMRKVMAWWFDEGLAFMTDLDEEGGYDYPYTFYVVDTTGKVVLPGPYEYAGRFYNGKAPTYIDGKGCVEINTKGEVLRKLGDWDCQEGC